MKTWIVTLSVIVEAETEDEARDEVNILSAANWDLAVEDCEELKPAPTHHNEAETVFWAVGGYQE